MLEVDPGAIVTLETNDCFTGQIRARPTSSPRSTSSASTRATGPIAVRGAEPGDSLVVELLEVRTEANAVRDADPRHRAADRPGAGAADAGLPRRWRHVHMNDRISFPLRPMVGVIGVATERRDDRQRLSPASTAAISTTTCTARARRSTCRCASRAGCSRSATCTRRWATARCASPGVEIAGEVTIRVGLLKGKQGTLAGDRARRPLGRPRHGGPDFMEALDRAVEEGARFLVDQWGFTIEEAFIFLSVACDANICQACRPQEFSTIARVSIPKVSATPRPFS